MTKTLKENSKMEWEDFDERLETAGDSSLESKVNDKDKLTRWKGLQEERGRGIKLDARREMETVQSWLPSGTLVAVRRQSFGTHFSFLIMAPSVKDYSHLMNVVTIVALNVETPWTYPPWPEDLRIHVVCCWECAMSRKGGRTNVSFRRYTREDVGGSESEDGSSVRPDFRGRYVSSRTKPIGTQYA